MMYHFLIVILVVAISREILSQEGSPVSPLLLDFIHEALQYAPQNSINPPTNDNSSIQYRLYTAENRNEPCYIEPSIEAFDKCSFNPKHETKFLIHGFVVDLPPGNLFEEIKNILMDHGSYNVIIVDWSLYNNIPFKSAYNNARIIGKRVSEVMNFITNHTGVSPETLHCIGHSLGCHVCGKAGRNTPNLGRITGLDPGAGFKLLSLKPNISLRYTDANFVDVIHTSDVYSGLGFGLFDAIGHMDFYPNGGVEQRHCENGNQFRLIENKVLTADNQFSKALCNHYIAVEYFRYSIFNNCTFVATKCSDYSSYQQNQCSTDDKPITAVMGFHSEKIPGIQPESKFFLNTLEGPPYCEGRE